MESVDFIIVGQGLAGTCLAWELLGRGMSVRIIDAGEPMTASKVSAGLLNPIIGRNYNLSWNFTTAFPAATAFYREREQELATEFYREAPMVRLFREAREREVFARKQAKGFYEGLLSDPQPEPLVPESVRNEFGGFEIARTGSVDTAVFLAASRQRFAELGCLVEASCTAEDVDPRLGGVRCHGLNADCMVMCLGHKGSNCPCFPWIQFRPAKGEILEVQLTDFAEHRILSGGNWLFPTEDGRWRTGTTYSWEPLDCEPTELAREVVEQRLGDLLPQSSWSVVDHRAAVRPIVHGRKPVLGRHPKHPRLAVFNGLGSKGALLAPWCSQHFADHLLNGTALHPEIDLASRFPMKLE